MIENNSKPCLVQTPQGFSVSYNGRLLYSKYNPQKAIIQSIENLNINEGSLILCFSCILNYGLFELAKKLPSNCTLLLCEADNELYNFQNEKITNLPENTLILHPEELYDLPLILQKKEYITKNGKYFSPAGNFKRVIRIDFSAGIQFHQDFYNTLFNSCIDSIKTYWTNRITLTKFGRKYSRNFFSNLKNLPNTIPIERFFNSISKSIVVCGAGESLEEGFELLKKYRKDFFIICVDTALSPLLKSNICPDAVFIEEAQSVISKAFIGSFNNDFHIFCGLSSIPQISHCFNLKNISFFTTLFSDSTFLQNMLNKNLLPSVNLPLGSVGLTAVEYAIKFRINDSIPIFTYGLDFSYAIGKTHAKNTMAHLQRLFSSNRIKSVENYAAAFGTGTRKFIDNNNHLMITTPSLQNYAQLFYNKFSSIKNLFASTNSGIDLKLTFKKAEPFSINEKYENIPQTEKWTNESIIDFFKQERLALEELRNILTGKTILSENERIEKIKQLAEPREYLYLHFPDGNNFSTDLSFLKRIRTEIDFFLKTIN